MFSILTALFFSTYTCVTVKLVFVNWHEIVYLWNRDFGFCWGLWQLPCLFFFFFTLIDLFRSSLSSRYSRSRLLLTLFYLLFLLSFPLFSVQGARFSWSLLTNSWERNSGWVAHLRGVPLWSNQPMVRGESCDTTSS